MNKIFLSTIALSALLSYGAPASAALDLNNNAVVTSSNGLSIHSLIGGTCVRTKWEAGEDVCASTQRAASTTTTLHTELTEEERSVYFTFDSAELTPLAKINLNGTVQRLLKANDVARADIVGYTDRLGDADYNVKLSARRATAVKNYLVQNGYLNVDVAQLSAMGEGNSVTSCPLHASRSSEISCLSPDRRVEIRLTYVDRALVTSTQ